MRSFIGFYPAKGTGFIPRDSSNDVPSFIPPKNRTKTVHGTSGDDTISISKRSDGHYDVTVNGNTVLYTEAQLRDLTIKAGNGNDTIHIGPGVDVPINVEGGGGQDRIYNYADGARIDGGTGDDYIYNRADGASVDGSDGDDRIRSVGDSNTITGSGGSDHVMSTGDRNVVRGGAGRDLMKVYGDFNFVHANEYGESLLTDAGLDLDSIYTSGRSNFVYRDHTDKIKLVG